MSTSLLYHSFGIRGYRQTRIEPTGGVTRFHVHPNEKSICCSSCQSSNVIKRGVTQREFRCSPIGLKQTVIVATLPRLQCRDCGVVRQIKVGFADARRSYTKNWANYALQLTRSMTIKDVADLLGVTWDVIKEIKKDDLRRRFANPSLKDVRRIAIDEICIGKGHRYVTLVMNLDSGAIIFVGDGKSAESLVPFWKRLGRRRHRIEAVAMDMSSAYISAVRGNLPKADIVFDRFHVVKLMNEKLTTLRRQLYQEATADEKSVLKGSRWLLLKNPENLSEDRDEEAHLAAALKLNEPLAKGYYLKEELRLFWGHTFRWPAQLFLRSWCRRATATGLSPLKTMAKTLTRLEEGLLSYFKHRISSGPMEGTNNKIKTLQRQSYGIRDREYFELLLYSLHQKKYALVG
ncbi:ISL3 family transposase [Allorhodopirellula heiligendammensis]|uniref:Transposase n=1 Tax=Allorhodopirellula heiligendammensis TaxID=2714739 RepID=A0A5C6BTW8_9BACT|nr:ISL3 family transposase [Allorhodopirellula heiligendammensis]TWU15468.1 Transposase [Allorhodopirellula heiligendammensis]